MQYCNQKGIFIPEMRLVPCDKARNENYLGAVTTNSLKTFNAQAIIKYIYFFLNQTPIILGIESTLIFLIVMCFDVTILFL